MAPRMKWTLAVLVLTASLAFAFSKGGLTTARVEEYRAQSRVWRVSNELGATRRAIVQWEALDSVRSVIPDSGVAFAWSTAADSGGAFAEVRDSIVAELDAMGGIRTRLAVLLRRSENTRGSGVTALPVQYFAERDSLGDWCAIVIDPAAARALTLRDAFFQGGSALGPCRFWARYGAPGPAIAGALPEFGVFLGAARPAPVDDQPFRRRLFGVRQWDAPSAPHVVAQACAAGRMDACERTLDPSTWMRSAFGFVQRGVDDPAIGVRARWDRQLGPPASFVAELERALGPESFAEFWRAGGEPGSALENATGVPAPQWMHGWIVARFGAEPRGPRVPPGTLLLTLLPVAALAAASLVVAARRRVA